MYPYRIVINIGIRTIKDIWSVAPNTVYWGNSPILASNIFPYKRDTSTAIPIKERYITPLISLVNLCILKL